MSRADQSFKREKASDLPRRFGNRDGLAEPVAAAEVEAHFELQIQPLARTEIRRCAGSRRLTLPERPLYRAMPDLHRRGPAVIGDRHPFVILRQRIFRRPQRAGRTRVIDAGIEIGVVRHFRRKMEGACDHGCQQIRRMPPDLIAGAALVEHIGDRAAQVAHRGETERKQ